MTFSLKSIAVGVAIAASVGTTLSALPAQALSFGQVDIAGTATIPPGGTSADFAPGFGVLSTSGAFNSIPNPFPPNFLLVGTGLIKDLGSIPFNGSLPDFITFDGASPDYNFTLTSFTRLDPALDVFDIKGFFGDGTKGRGTLSAQGGLSYSATLATVVPTPALLPGLIGMGVAALRKRNKAEASETETADANA